MTNAKSADGSQWNAETVSIDVFRSDSFMRLLLDRAFDRQTDRRLW